MAEFFKIWVIAGYALSVLGFIMAILLFSKMRSQQVHPGSTLAWLLGMVFMPYIAIPLYLAFGGNKLKRVRRAKSSLSHKEFKGDTFPPPNSAAQDAIFALKDAPPATTGNSMEFITDGVDTYNRLMEHIEKAEKSINFIVFIITKDAVSDALIDALARRARQGIKVRLLVDSLGCFWTKGSYLDPLRDAGGQIGIFMPVAPLRRRSAANFRMHRKMFLFDEKYAFVSGKNMGAQYLGPHPDTKRWLDSTLYIRGPAVCNLGEIFAADWSFATGEEEEHVNECRSFEEFEHFGTTPLQVVASGPDAPNEPFYEVLLTAMFHAKRRIWIVTPYFVPDETILRILCILAKLGRDVRLVVPQSSDLILPDLARRYPMRELFKAGAKIYLYQPTILHAKLFLIDDDVASVGSPNMDMRSLYLNFEIATFIYTRPEIEQVDDFIKSILPHCILYTRYHGRVRGILTETMENVARLLSPLI